MKCDVCDTKIPIGQHQCPKCGYKMPIKKVGTYNINSASHEHIKSTQYSSQKRSSSYTTQSQTDLKSTINEMKKNPKVGFDYLKKYPAPNIGKPFIFLIVIFMVFGVLVPTVVNVFNQINRNAYEDYTFQEVIDKGYDDGTVQLALNYENEMYQLYEKLGIKEITREEYCRDEEKIDANVYIEGYYEGVLYRISTSFKDKKIYSNNLFIYGDSKKSIVDEFQGDKTIIEELGKKMNIDSIVDDIENGRKSMVEGEEEQRDMLVYQHADPYIYLTERQRDNRDMYHFTIMYDFFLKY
ncbi:MAG: hypothetical protein RR558_04960 [Coprobacillus sp.]